MMTTGVKNRRSLGRRMKHFFEGMASIFDITGGHLEPKSAEDYLADAKAMVKNAEYEALQHFTPGWHKVADDYGMPSKRKRVRVRYTREGDKITVQGIEVEPVEKE